VVGYIGAYRVDLPGVCLHYLLIRSDLTLNLIALGLMLGCSVCSEAGLFSTIGFIQYLPSEATLHAFGLTGVVASILMQRFANPERPNCFLLLFLQIGIGMLIAGVVSHNFWIISKLTGNSHLVFLLLLNLLPFIRIYISANGRIG
jgi:hypothetical protein